MSPRSSRHAGPAALRVTGRTWLLAADADIAPSWAGNPVVTVTTGFSEDLPP